MSRKIRLVAALLILFLFTFGSLNALPLGHPVVPAERGAGTLMAVVDWFAALFSWDRPHGIVPKHPRPKTANQLDPDGTH